jgi:hypothetical protein
MSYRSSVKLLKSLNDVRDDFIYEAQEGLLTKNTISKKRKILPIVACLVFLFFSVTILASTDWGIYLIEKFTSRTETGSDYVESGYDMNIDVEKKSIQSLKGEIQKVPEFIVEQFETYDMLSSWFPGHWQETFITSEEAVDFIGLKELRVLKWKLNEEQVILDVFGNENGDILSIRLETRYESDNIRIQAISSIFTEKDKNPIEIGVRTIESIEFEEIFYESSNHVKCFIISSSALESGYSGLDGYLVHEGILYNLHIAYQEDDKNDAEELLYLWIDTF